MSGFTQQAFEKKLTEFNSSQQSIQTLSLWLIHHRKHFKAIVQTWFKEFKKAKPSRRLAFMYLANDVIQNSKKRGPEFSKEFLNVLKLIFQFLAKDVEPATLSSLDRLVNIWEERAVYDKSHIKVFRQALHPSDKVEVNENNNNTNNSTTTGKESTNSKSTRKRENDSSSNAGKDTSGHNNNGHSNKKLRSDQLDSSLLNNVMAQFGDNSSLDIDKYEKVEPEKLIKSLKSLEKSASGDASVRQKIANLPSEVFDVKLIENVINPESAEHWTKLVDDAQEILRVYNSRLAAELEDRRKLQTQLAYFIEGQRRDTTQAEQSLNEYRTKLKKVEDVSHQLQSHLASLPDLSELTNSVTPLPSALDLFKL